METESVMDRTGHFDPAGRATAAVGQAIAVFLDASPSGQKRAAHAVTLAKRWGANVVGVQVVAERGPMPGYMYNARGRDAGGQMIEYERRLVADAQAAAQVVGERFQALCARMQIRGEFRRIGPGQADQEAILHAFQSDLIVVGHPEPHGLPAHMAPEKILLETGGPLLIIPNDWEGETIGQQIVIGWNATPTARHAVVDALAFLGAARSVTVLLIDPAKHWGHGRAPGADVALYLTRHGAPVIVEELRTRGSPVAEALLGYLENRPVDLLVLGAYSHARMRELILGGVTRTLLARVPVPVLISG
jgi:nucleotide-binding universal stress UspA family protein